MLWEGQGSGGGGGGLILLKFANDPILFEKFSKPRPDDLFFIPFCFLFKYLLSKAWGILLGQRPRLKRSGRQYVWHHNSQVFFWGFLAQKTLMRTIRSFIDFTCYYHLKNYIPIIIIRDIIIRITNKNDL